MGNRVLVAVLDDGDVRSGQATTVHEGGVVQAVGDDEVTALAEGGKSADVRGVAAGEEQRGWSRNPVGECRLEPDVFRVRTVDQAGRSRPNPTVGRCFT